MGSFREEKERPNAASSNHNGESYEHHLGTSVWQLQVLDCEMQMPSPHLPSLSGPRCLEYLVQSTSREPPSLTRTHRAAPFNPQS